MQGFFLKGSGLDVRMCMGVTKVKTRETGAMFDGRNLDALVLNKIS